MAAVMENQKPIPEWQDEKRPAPLFAPPYYVAHLIIILYILVGIGTQTYQYLTFETYRVLSVATWPWVYTGQWVVLLLSVLVYGGSLMVIGFHMRKKLDEMEITWLTMIPYSLFAFVWLAMFGRLLIYLISPEGVFLEQ